MKPGKIQELSLHLVRGGPPENQLVSRITPYIALCGPYGASTVHLPWNHQELMRRIARLRYSAREQAGTVEIGQTDRTFTLRELGTEVGAVLGQVEGLRAELAEAGQAVADGGLVHLRLRTWGNELSLLPFEVAIVPQGAPGESQRAALKSPPVCVTREVMGARVVPGLWKRTPKVLFVWANPSSQVPSDSCLVALMEAVSQLVPWSPKKKLRTDAVAEVLTLLPEASLESLSEACAAAEYTHIFLLAHGAQTEEEGERRFGVALHAAPGSPTSRVVSGEELARAITPVLPGDGMQRAPSVVTLAICDGGNAGSVVIPGGSIAHALHQHGVPWVVASQFPLYFRGAVKLARVWMGKLLGGSDPRWALQAVRHALAQRSATDHDWGALVAYAASWRGFDDEQRSYAYQQLQARVNAANKSADALAKSETTPRLPTWDSLEADIEDAFESFHAVLPEASAQTILRPYGDRDDPERAEVWGRLGSARKKLGIAAWGAGMRQQARRHFIAAWQAYGMARQVSVDLPHWQMVQELALTVVLGKPVDNRTLKAVVAATSAARARADADQAMSANGSWLELHVLASTEAAQGLKKLLDAGNLEEAVRAIAAERKENPANRARSARSALGQLSLYKRAWAGFADERVVEAAMDALGGPWSEGNEERPTPKRAPTTTRIRRTSAASVRDGQGSEEDEDYRLQHGAGENGFRYWEARKGAGLNVPFGWFAVTGPFPTTNRGFGLDKEKWSTSVHLSTVGDFRLLFDESYDGSPASEAKNVRLSFANFGSTTWTVPGDGTTDGSDTWRVWRAYKEAPAGQFTARDVYLAVKYSSNGTTTAVYWYAKAAEIQNNVLIHHDEPLKFKHGEGPPTGTNTGFARAGGAPL